MDMDFFKPGVLDQCCMTGMQWSNTSGRCTGYPGPVPGVAPESQGPCLSIVEVCCLKQVQLDMCESGKRTALDRLLCAVRDSEAGAEQFRVSILVMPCSFPFFVVVWNTSLNFDSED